MDGLHRLAFTISRVGTWVGGALLLLTAVIVAIDVVMRALFARSVGGADELSGYALAIATAWGLSFALLERSHIRIDSLYEKVSLRMRAILDLVSLVAFFLFMGLTTWYGWLVLSQSITSNARSISAISTPLALPQAVWFAGLVFLLLVTGLLFVEGAMALVRGDLAKVARLIGSKAVIQEVDAEKSSLARNHPESAL
ncbi:MAG TPA: TRAP transporter small permease [Bauldia sp.]|nr:TRAP transporter small permease [Bauldia sp.]